MSESWSWQKWLKVKRLDIESVGISQFFIPWPANEICGLVYKTINNFLYVNKYSSIIYIYFHETFSTQTSSAWALSHLLDTLSNILDKCCHFSLIKIGSVPINPSQAMLGSFFSSFLFTFQLKMLLLVLIKNCNSFVYLI